MATCPQADKDSPAQAPSGGWLGRSLLLFTLFMVVAGNAIVPIWSGLIPVMLLMPLAILLRTGPSPSDIIVDRLALPWLVTMGSLAVVGLGSVLVNQGGGLNWVTWLSSYVSPIVVYMATRQYCDDMRSVRMVALVVLIAASVPLLFGLLQYYREWGVPSGVELLLSRYDLVRMDGYMKATFGNTSSTASYLVLVLPLAISLSLTRGLGTRMRWFALFVTTIALANTVIVQSRALLWVMLLAMPAILWFYRVRAVGFVIVLAILAAAFVLPFMEALDELMAQTTSVFGGAQADNSVSERLHAMHHAVWTLYENPALGVGPGNTMIVNPYTSAHQFWLQQGSEIGVGGLIASVALTVILVLRFLGVLWRRGSGVHDQIAFACIGGAAFYLTYGVLANVALANTFVNAWVGLFAVLVALGEASDTLRANGNSEADDASGNR